MTIKTGTVRDIAINAAICVVDNQLRRIEGILSAALPASSDVGEETESYKAISESIRLIESTILANDCISGVFNGLVDAE